jgi:hypothetical protein
MYVARTMHDLTLFDFKFILETCCATLMAWARQNKSATTEAYYVAFPDTVPRSTFFLGWS